MGTIINKELKLMTETNNEKVYFPILVSISDRKCLIIGGGPIALHKVQSLEKFTSDITILSPTVVEKLQQMADKNGYKIITKEYETSDLDGFELVIAASGKKALSKQIWEECKERKILINAVDDPEHCDFILPATIKRGDLTVSIGTQGKSPFMTKEIRRWMNRMFTPEWSEVVDLAADYRKQVFAKYSPKQRTERDQCFARFVEIDWAELLREKPPEELKNVVEDVLEGREIKFENPKNGE
jgi:precorrin-2 dehydrogenase / sirohydrochlorin ferrochelatase